MFMEFLIFATGIITGAIAVLAGFEQDYLRFVPRKNRQKGQTKYRLVIGKESGFTLIELLVVVAILGVLASVAVPNIAKFMGEGSHTAIQANAAAIQTAADAYATKNGGDYPTTEDGLKALVPDYLRAWPPLGNYTITDGTVHGE